MSKQTKTSAPSVEQPATEATSEKLQGELAGLGIGTELSEYEQRVLAATPRKVRTFLSAVSSKVQIRALLFAAGYSQEAQAQGWALFNKVRALAPRAAVATSDAAVRGAVAALDAWDESGFRRVSAALERLHPEQHSFVFGQLQPAQGAAAVVTVQTLLDRLDELEAGTRTGASAGDAAAIATLTARGINPALRTRLRKLIGIAQTFATPTVDTSTVLYTEALLALRAWYKDWAMTARAVITRKDYLVMLGLSKRRREDVSDETEGTADTAVAIQRVTEPSK